MGGVSPWHAGEPGASGTRRFHINKRLQRLFISRVGQRNTGCATCVEFLIGGRMNSTVGLFYEPNAAAVPTMHPNSIIAIKPLGNGWYLYKTS